MPDEKITVVETTETIVITETPTQVVEIAQPEKEIIEVVARGPQGPAGEAGPNEIGGYPILMIGSAENDDILSFSTSIMAWYNRKQETLTDGGNF